MRSIIVIALLLMSIGFVALAYITANFAYTLETMRKSKPEFRRIGDYDFCRIEYWNPEVKTWYLLSHDYLKSKEEVDSLIGRYPTYSVIEDENDKVYENTYKNP